MKKRRSRIKHHTRRATKRASSHDLPIVVTRRFIVFSTCLLLAIGIFAYTNKRTINQSVAGVSVVRFLYGQETVTLPRVSGATAYNVYYKKTDEPTFSNAARDIPANVTSYTISYLQKGSTYLYRISALDNTGTEFWWSDTLPLSNITPM